MTYLTLPVFAGFRSGNLYECTLPSVVRVAFACNTPVSGDRLCDMLMLDPMHDNALEEACNNARWCIVHVDAHFTRMLLVNCSVDDIANALDCRWVGARK